MTSLVYYVQIFSFVDNFGGLVNLYICKRYGIRNLKSNVGIFTNTFMAAILDYKIAGL